MTMQKFASKKVIPKLLPENIMLGLMVNRQESTTFKCVISNFNKISYKVQFDKLSVHNEK